MNRRKRRSPEELRREVQKRLKAREEEKAEKLAAVKEKAEELRAERLAKEKAEKKRKAEELRKRQQHHQDQIENRLKNEMRLAWLDEGGDPAEFEEEWPELKQELLRQRTMARMTSQSSVRL